MVLFLVLDVLYYSGNLRFRIGEGSIAFLPSKWLWRRIIMIDPFRRRTFDDLHQRRKRFSRMHPHENVNMIRHSINNKA